MLNQKDVEAVRQTVEDYLVGSYEGDVERLSKAFHAKASVIGNFGSKLTWMNLEDFLNWVKTSPKASDSDQPYDMSLVSLDVTGDAASAKVDDMFMGLKFTDYLSLVKVDGAWVIVNKTYRLHPKGK